MKKNGKYRFSLQFGADTEQEWKAGELLERLGNKKSVVVVAALNEYLSAHPELQNAGRRIEIKVDSGYNRKGIEEFVREVIERQLRTYRPEEFPSNPSEHQTADLLESDVMQMFDNLDMFQ